MDTSQQQSFIASLTTIEGFRFDVTVTMKTGYSYFSGDAWKEYCRVYQLKVVDDIILDIGTAGLFCHVICGNWPMLHPSNTQFLLLLTCIAWLHTIIVCSIIL